MEEMNFHDVAAPTLPRILAAARCFGLSGAQVWETANEALDATGGDGHAPEYADELAGALARRILAENRQIIARRRGIRLADDGPTLG
jgi:hypothetical protein